MSEAWERGLERIRLGEEQEFYRRHPVKMLITVEEMVEFVSGAWEAEYLASEASERWRSRGQGCGPALAAAMELAVEAPMPEDLIDEATGETLPEAD